MLPELGLEFDRLGIDLENRPRQCCPVIAERDFVADFELSKRPLDRQLPLDPQAGVELLELRLGEIGFVDLDH